MHWLTFPILLLALASHANDQIRVFTIEEPPFNFIDDDGELTGISVDFVHAMRERMDTDFEVTLMPWVRAYKMAQTEPGVVLFTAARIKERENLFHWITPVVQNSWNFFSHSGSVFSVNNLEDLKQVRGIGVMRGGAREAYLREHGFTNLVTASTYGQLNKMLASERISLFFFAESGLIDLSDQAAVDVSCISDVFQVTPPRSYIVMSKATSPAIVDRWKQAAAELKADGTYERIAKKWQNYLQANCGISSAYQDGVLDFTAE